MEVRIEKSDLHPSFLFLGDLLDLRELSAYEITDNYVFKRADDLQIEYIKKHIDLYSKILSHGLIKYEHERHETERGFTFQRLNKSDWNYWIIEFPFHNSEIEFTQALSLSSIDLTPLLEGHYDLLKTNKGDQLLPGIKSRSIAAFNFYNDKTLHEEWKKKITDKDINEVKSIYVSIKVFQTKKNKFDFLGKCLDDYVRLQDISNQSPFKILGYFAILEHLLTTNKKAYNDISINNQLQRKFNLINNQFGEKIDIADYFEGANTNTLETILSKLYLYRNDIAHGNRSDFEKDLSLLKNSKSRISDFLRVLVKSGIVYALGQPELVNDLREC